MSTKYYVEYVATGNTKLQLEDDIFLNKTSGYTGIGVDPVTNLDIDGQIRLSDSTTYNEGEIRYLLDKLWVNTGGTSTTWAPMGFETGGASGSSGTSGSDGSSGLGGNDGANSDRWFYNSGVTAFDNPTSTMFATNVPLSGDITSISINREDSVSRDVLVWLRYLESEVDTYGYIVYLKISGLDNDNAYGFFSVSGVTEQTNHFDLDVTNIDNSSIVLTHLNEYTISWSLNGLDGSSGTSGTSGSSGAGGTSGSSGDGGTSGSSGGTGVTGSSGSSGDDGTEGTSGSSGSSGTGTSGSSGAGDNAWTTWSPTITWGGTTPTVSNSVYRYTYDEYTVHIITAFSISTGGGACTSASIPLPKSVTDIDCLVPVSCKRRIVATITEEDSAYINASDNTPANRVLMITFSPSITTTSTIFYVSGFYEWYTP